MKDFLSVAFPWIVAGICVAVLAVQMSRKRSKQKENHMLEGMCLGMCFGMCAGAFFGWIGIDGSGTELCMGMLIGEVIGVMIPKREEKENNR